MTELPKTFDPAAIEARWYAHWEETGLFRPERPDAEPFTIVIPPPNVTGSLHIGHALDNTLQDILVRHARLKGKDALWVVGTDHAGIATQMVVERQMDAQGREAHRFHAARPSSRRCGSGRPRAAATITRQLRRLGASCDWANERFTMDEGFSKAVRPRLRRALQAGAALPRQAAGQLGSRPQDRDLRSRGRDARGRRASSGTCAIRWRTVVGAIIAVATTRPETMLADMAVAVNPDGRALHGADRQAGPAADHRPADPDRRRRACRSGAGLGRGEDHAGP